MSTAITFDLAGPQPFTLPTLKLPKFARLGQCIAQLRDHMDAQKLHKQIQAQAYVERLSTLASDRFNSLTDFISQNADYVSRLAQPETIRAAQERLEMLRERMAARVGDIHLPVNLAPMSTYNAHQYYEECEARETFNRSALKSRINFDKMTLSDTASIADKIANWIDRQVGADIQKKMDSNRDLRDEPVYTVWAAQRAQAVASIRTRRKRVDGYELH